MEYVSMATWVELNFILTQKSEVCDTKVAIKNVLGI